MIDRMGPVLGKTALLLLFSAAGFALFARHGLDQGHVATVLLALYLASWSFVVGLAGIALFVGWRLAGWLTGRRTGGIRDGCSVSDPRSRRLKQDEPESPSAPERDAQKAGSTRVA
jgi:hypothetical protein